MLDNSKRNMTVCNPSNNNIKVSKEVISEILSNNQISVNRNSPGGSYCNSQSKSESIQIFKINPEVKDSKKSVKKGNINSVTNFNQMIQLEPKKETPKEKEPPHKLQPKDQDSISLHTSSINLNISERMSKIENKLSNINARVNNSQFKEKNLDSRVKSHNDLSAYEESKIIKNKSFFSVNNA